MKDIGTCRKEIDEIDRKLTELLVHRLYLASDIAVYKKENKLPIYDEKREQDILRKIALLSGPQYEESVTNIYEAILKESKKRQMDVLDWRGYENRNGL